MEKLDVQKGIIYYTDNQLGEPIYSVVQGFLLASGLPIVSSSLIPIDFGNNEVVEGKRSYSTMIRQILSCLERGTVQYVFFCEHDVLYPREHFDFIPLRNDIFYYNNNVWRWRYGDDLAITYDRMLPLSCLCVNREFALNHYRARWKRMEQLGPERFSSREPEVARKWGYEPGTKKKRRGGFSDDDFETWSSEYPVIDIRHSKTFSPPKCTLKSFKHQPVNWRETNVDQIPGWNLKKLFRL